MKELIKTAKNNIHKILDICSQASNNRYTACYFGESGDFIVSNIQDGNIPSCDYIHLGFNGACKTKDDVIDRINFEIY